MLALLILCFVGENDPTPITPAKLDRKTEVDFVKEIQPIFAAKCIVCHSGKLTEGNYDMSTLALAIKGGKRGAAIVPKKPDESFAFLFSAHRKKPVMPPKSEDNPLTAQEVALIERWISEGAKGPAEATIAKTSVMLKVAENVKPVRAVAINKELAVIARGNVVSLYDVKKGEKLGQLLDPILKDSVGKLVNASHVSLVESMALSSDGKTLVTGSFRTITIWDLPAKTVRHRIDGFAHSVVALALSSNGLQLAVGSGTPSEDGEIKFVDTMKGIVTHSIKQPHTDTVYGLAFSPDGKRLASSSADKYVKVFDVVDGQAKFLKSFEGHTQHVLDVVWTADGKRIASAGSDNQIKIWDIEKGEKVRDIQGFAKQVTRLSSFAQTAYAASGEGVVKSINLENGNNNRTLKIENGFVFAVACSQGGELMLAGGESGVAILYETQSGKMLKQFE